jgi:hypothetical protein
MAMNVYEEISQLSTIGNIANDLQRLHLCLQFVGINKDAMVDSFANTFVLYYGNLSKEEKYTKAKNWYDKFIDMQKKKEYLNLNQLGVIAQDNEIMPEEEPNIFATPNSSGDTTKIIKMANLAIVKAKVTPHPFYASLIFGLSNAKSIFNFHWISNTSKVDIYQPESGEVITVQSGGTPLYSIIGGIIKSPNPFIAGTESSIEISLEGSGIQQLIQKSQYTQ